uniref:Uncharacterized protein n=1 Tax=Ditylenchus dipsaci TaxID=166011 RepID=A0A915DNW2_9BILA
MSLIEAVSIDCAAGGSSAAEGGWPKKSRSSSLLCSAIINTLPGVKFFLQPESLLCSKLVDALYVLVSKNSNSQYDQPIVTILGLLAATSFLVFSGSTHFLFQKYTVYEGVGVCWR